MSVGCMGAGMCSWHRASTEGKQPSRPVPGGSTGTLGTFWDSAGAGLRRFLFLCPEADPESWECPAQMHGRLSDAWGLPWGLAVFEVTPCPKSGEAGPQEGTGGFRLSPEGPGDWGEHLRPLGSIDRSRRAWDRQELGFVSLQIQELAREEEVSSGHSLLPSLHAVSPSTWPRSARGPKELWLCPCGS